VPAAADVPLVKKLEVVETTWGYLSTVTTFTLSFFLNQCYDAWRTTFSYARQMQGRLMDMSLALSTHAQRDAATGRYTPEAQAMLDDATRLARAAHVLHWMSQDVALRLLHNDAGLDALAKQGLLTPQEAQRIKASEGPVNPRWQMPLAWLMARVADARQGGLLGGGDAVHLYYLQNVGKLRGCMGSMQDANTDRMPLAYVHLNEVLVDMLLVIAPLALYPETGDLSVPLVMLLTFFYYGVLELSKSFLDPFGNAGSFAQNIDTQVLITEMNRDLPRWAATASEVPCLLLSDEQ